jgi:hypothetical protein
MKGSEIIKKIGVEQIHCSLGKNMITLDPEHDYVIIRGTENHPRIISDEQVAMIKAGKYPRLRLNGMEAIADVEWTTGHHPFEGDIEPKLSPERDKLFFIK